MGRANSRQCKKTHERRSERWSKIGRAFEQEGMRKILEEMVADGLLSDFQISFPNSPEDREGKDIKVSQMIGSESINEYFGITISFNAWNDAKRFHPDIPQFCFPIGTKPETIKKRILSLFPKASK